MQRALSPLVMLPSHPANLLNRMIPLSLMGSPASTSPPAPSGAPGWKARTNPPVTTPLRDRIPTRRGVDHTNPSSLIACSNRPTRRALIPLFCQSDTVPAGLICTAALYWQFGEADPTGIEEPGEEHPSLWDFMDQKGCGAEES
jgi:hypothetical protein